MKWNCYAHQVVDVGTDVGSALGAGLWRRLEP